MDEQTKSRSTLPSPALQALRGRVAQLRTGHNCLHKYLARFHVIDSPTCACGLAHETVQHFLLICPQYDQERDRLRQKVGIQGIRVDIDEEACKGNTGFHCGDKRMETAH